MPKIHQATEYTPVSFSKDGYGYVATPPPPVKATPKTILRAEHDKEELARIREMSDAKISEHRFPDQENFKDKTRQMGRPLHSGTLTRLVAKLNPALICEDSLNCRGNAGFYYSLPDGSKKFTGAHFKKGILPEFSIIETDAADLPVRIQYGWREVLARLVKAAQLKMADVIRVFGDTTTVQSSQWRRSIRNFR